MGVSLKAVAGLTLLGLAFCVFVHKDTATAVVAERARDAVGLLPAITGRASETIVWDEPLSSTSGLIASRAIAFDEARGDIVIFGGSDNRVAANNVTLLWDGRSLSQVTIEVSPPPRSSATMAYDPAHEKTVLFGGDGASGALGDTWTWDGIGWTPERPLVSPSPRRGAAMTYDAAHRQVLLFGGRAADGTLLSDLWTWDGAAWSALSTPVAPPAREAAGMAFDGTHANVVLFGGGNQTSAGTTQTRSDTWIWDGATWSEAAPVTSPSARYAPAMVYDGRRQAVVLASGYNLAWDGWAWDGANWTPITAPAPSGTAGAVALAYDRVRGEVLEYGGVAATYRWTPTAITPVPTTTPPPRAGAGIDYDAKRGIVVMFGGGPESEVVLGDTWEWNLGWYKRTPAQSPPGRAQLAMAFDQARAVSVVFGGEDANDKAFGDTWLWDGTTWTAPALTVSPPARLFAALAYDEVNRVAVLFGGKSATTALLGDTWLWDGAKWTQAFPAVSPTARYGPSMTYDRAHSRVLLFGGVGSGGYQADTWTWDGTTWTEAAAPMTNGPAARGESGLAYDSSEGHALLFGGFASGGLLSDEWTWDGAAWNASTLPALVPSARGGAAMTYDLAAGRTVLFGGDGPIYSTGDTWLRSSNGAGCTNDGQCNNAFCVDGVCCAVSSCGTCQTCAGEAPGTCSILESAPDPDSCTGASACDGTGACKPSNGQMCSDGKTCASGFCVEGICCDSACDGVCQSCTGKGKGGGSEGDGVCGNVAEGTDPRDACALDSERSCGKTGVCDGKGACAIASSGAPCGANFCDENRSAGLFCDGHGACNETFVAKDCAPYICDNASAACITSCKSDNDCSQGNTCIAGSCTARVSGASCDGDHAVVAPDGTKNDCAPYICSGDTCKDACSSIRDCVSGYICSESGFCVGPGSAELASGCALGSTDDVPWNGSTWSIGLGIAGICTVRRRAARRPRKQILAV